MSDDEKKERDLVNIQIDREVHQMFSILRERYGKRRLSDAVEAFIEEHDHELAEVARKVVELSRRSAKLNGDDERN